MKTYLLNIMITVYGLTHCPYTKTAEKLLKKRKLRFKIIWVTNENKQKYKKKHKMDTFPQIFLGKKKIGGMNDLEDVIAISDEIIELNLDPTLFSPLIKELTR